MSLFTEDDYHKLVSEFPDKPVREILNQVDKKAASGQPVGSPMGLAASWLRSAKSTTSARENPPVLAGLGTFMQDGHWNSGANSRSHYESDLSALAIDARKGFMSPAEVSEKIHQLGLDSMAREVEQSIWKTLPTYDHWPCAPTSTSAEQWLKTFVMGS